MPDVEIPQAPEKELDGDVREGRNLMDSMLFQISKQLLHKSTRSKSDLDNFMKGIALLTLPTEAESEIPCSSTCSGTDIWILCLEAP